MFKTGFQYSCFAGSISAKSVTEEEKNNTTSLSLFPVSKTCSDKHKHAEFYGANWPAFVNKH